MIERKKLKYRKADVLKEAIDIQPFPALPDLTEL